MKSRWGKKSETVDAYIKTFPKEVQKLLQTIRKTVKAAAPEAQELISYRIPALKLSGKILVYYAAHKEHIGLYPPAPKTVARLTAKYAGPRGNLKFFYDEPLPLLLIKKIVQIRAKEILAKTKGR